ncbi:MAG: GLPGLI family protein [Spirosomataceae bacterium]|jgi:GLPGLI family protein
MLKSFFIVSSFLITATSYCQDYKVAYRLSYPETSEVNKQEDFYLYSTPEQSTFISNFKVRKDSVMKYNKSDIGSKMAAYKAIPKTKFDFFVLKKYKTSTVLFAQKVGMYIAYQQIAPTYDWKIVDSTKEIQGFSCRKAILSLYGNTYNVWFTDEIPVFDGPYFFQGLPGLILEVSCVEQNYQFTLVGIEKGVSPVDYPDKSFKELTNDREKFIRLADDWEKNTMSNLFKTGDISMGSSGSSSEEIMKQFQTEIDEKRPKFKLEIF